MKTIYEFLLCEHLLNEHLLKSKTAVSTQQYIGCVDLGLKSGLLWGDRNVGAEKPTDTGDYFMWGSTEPYTDKPCDWEHSPLNKNRVCPNDVLAPEYDATTVILGSNWRMPTCDDFHELIDNTNYIWTKNYNDSGVDGMLFTSKINGEQLFMPDTGFMYGKSGNGTIMSTVYLWSSSLHHPGNAFNFYCNESNSCCMLYDDFCFGFCLRGVK